MHSHIQHLARYCMLSHSKPHVTNIKTYPKVITDSILKVYAFVSDLITDSIDGNSMHPFASQDDDGVSSAFSHRESLRTELMGTLATNSDFNVDPSIMFESCSVQPTTCLGFHQDTMNCPMMDNTILCFVPSHKKCLSFLFYSRKCIGDYTKRQSVIDTYIQNTASDQLTKLCLKSIMHVGGIFDYQASHIEATASINSIAQSMRSKKTYSCEEVEAYTGLLCFKHGAAFDKIGFYSIFLNIFCSLHYCGYLLNLNDSISLAMFFGLVLCNGTSYLASVWNELERQEVSSVNYITKKKMPTSLF
jgi:hypothetical protein